MRRADSLEKTLMLGGFEGRRRGDDRGWDGWMASLTRWTWVWLNSGSWWWTGRPGVLRFMGESWTRPSDWTENLGTLYNGKISEGYTIHSIVNQGTAPKHQCPDFLLGFHHVDFVDWLPKRLKSFSSPWGLSSVTWPERSTESHLVHRLSMNSQMWSRGHCE